MEHTENIQREFNSLPVRQVAANRPFQWLAAGWRDLIRAPRQSLSFGLAFALVGFLLIGLGASQPHLVTSAVSGFFLIGPFLALGLYQISRRLERSQPVSLKDAMVAWQGNYSLGLFAALLAFALISWERISAILFALLYSGNIATLDNLAYTLFLSGEHVGFALAYIVVGGILAVLVFAFSVVAVPAMLDQRCDTITAMVTSLQAARGNVPAMALWAVLIVALVGLGFATAFLGLIVLMPLLGHATWHAYRDLVEPDSGAS